MNTEIKDKIFHDDPLLQRGFTHGGRREAFARNYGLDIDRIVDFSANINPLGPPPSVAKAIKRSISAVRRYPEENGELEESLARYIKVKPSNVLPGNGSAEIIHLLVGFLKPRRVMIIAPTFTEYERAAIINECEIEHLTLSDSFLFDTAKICEAAARSDLVFICNPNNPTGSLITREEILAIRQSSPRAYFAIDEAFMDFLPDEEGYSVIKDALIDDRLLVIRSLGKFFSLAGLRIGYLVAQSELVALLNRRRIPWSVNGLASTAAVAAMSDKKFIKRSKEEIGVLRKELESALKQLSGINVYPSTVNFFLVELTEPEMDALKLQDRLAAEGIMIRLAGDFVTLNNSFFRISVGNRRANWKLVNAFRKVLT